MLEALIDGVPSPEIQLSKNGERLFEKENLNISRKNNRVTISIENASIADAGRYEILATNGIGCASSSADIVVKSMLCVCFSNSRRIFFFSELFFSIAIIFSIQGTTFPPVFCQR